METGRFYTSTVPQETLVGSTSKGNEISIDDVERFFELNECIQWIQEKNLKRVALQFPDQFLKFSRRIYEQLEAKTGCKAFILADTSYRSCCVDELAAAHASCDGIIHYGDACLSRPAESIPVKYVFGRFPVDLCSLKEKLGEVEVEQSQPLLLLLVDSVYEYATENISEAVSQTFKSCDILKSHVIQAPDQIASSAEMKLSLGRLVPERFFDADNVKVLFIGSPDSPFLPLWLMSHPQCSQVIHFDPQTNDLKHTQPLTIRNLRKRLFLVETLKDAGIVGLVIGTAAIKGHREAVQRMRELCKLAGKKLYVFSVGKVNVAKLANFAESVDVFVLLSCPFGILLDSSDFYRPVLSYFEAEIALNPDKQWYASAGWTADFTQLLEEKIGVKSPDEENADVSLVSGRIRAAPAQDETSTDGTMTTLAVYTAGDYFSKRSWKGLDDSVSSGVEENSTKLANGRSGIASGYENEK